MKRIILMMLLVTMLFLLVTGCGNGLESSDDTFPTTDNATANLKAAGFTVFAENTITVGEDSYEGSSLGAVDADGNAITIYWYASDFIADKVKEMMNSFDEDYTVMQYTKRYAYWGTEVGAKAAGIASPKKVK